ncbi:MAG: SagB/ThcOx family dehydrogenase [Anaerolineaceae bacterium]|nr:SagB/ThcOx family dehydrogenase [Anaerolineaceae bacterium]
MKDQAYYKQLAEELTRAARHSLRAYDFYDDSIPDDYYVSDQAAGIPAPPLEKAIPENAIRITLPSIENLNLGKMPLVDVLKKRQSHREYTAGSLSLEEIAFLCWSVAGVREVHPNGIFTKRISPSGGARHPFETYLVIQRVNGVEPGIYRYSGLNHQLILVKPGSHYCSELAEKAMQPFVKQSAITFIWTVIPYRNEWRYLFTSAREVAMDIGHYCENLYLAAESINVGICAVASYRQEIVDAILEVDGKDEFTIYIAPAGKI